MTTPKKKLRKREVEKLENTSVAGAAAGTIDGVCTADLGDVLTHYSECDLCNAGDQA